VPRGLSQLHNDRAATAVTPAKLPVLTEFERRLRERRRKIKDPSRLELDQLIFGPGIGRKKGHYVLSLSLAFSRTSERAQSRKRETKSSTTLFLRCRSATSNRWHAIIILYDAHFYIFFRILFSCKTEPFYFVNKSMIMLSIETFTAQTISSLPSFRRLLKN